jgi:shikimate dehydrogenase
VKSSSDSRLTGLLGRDLQGSLSPALHNECYRSLGISGLYQPVDFTRRNIADEDLPDILASLIRLGFSGVNVTHPFKTAVLPLLDEVSEDAMRLGAVNTVVIRDGKTTGYNTDWLGFSAQLTALDNANVTVQGPALVMGAGGAGRAVIHALLKKPVSPVLLYDPDTEQAQATIAHFGSPDIQLVEDIEAAAAESHLLVNASTVGMHGKGGLPLAEHLIRPDHMVAEVVYFPVETNLVQLARTRGCNIATGDIMCLDQALASFILMTDLIPDSGKMKDFFTGLLVKS